LFTTILTLCVGEAVLFFTVNDNKEIHLRVLSRGRKKETIIQGIHNLHKYSSKDNPEEVKNWKKMLSSLNSEFHCSGGIVEDRTYGKIIKMTGDHRERIKDYLVKNELIRIDDIKFNHIKSNMAPLI